MTKLVTTNDDVEFKRVTGEVSDDIKDLWAWIDRLNSLEEVAKRYGMQTWRLADQREID